MVALAILARGAVAQGPHYDPQLVQPFMDPFDIMLDGQIFAPPEVNDYGNSARPRTGWYGSYDRLYVYVSRPAFGGAKIPDALQNELPSGFLGIETSSHYNNDVRLNNDFGDNTYGNRIDWGYMTEDHHGWSFSLTKLGSPNNFLVLRTEIEFVGERSNDPGGSGDDDDDDGGGDGGVGGDGDGGDDGDSTNRFTDNNGETIRDMQTSINAGTYFSFEVNKTFRQSPFHNGIVFEPLMGIRYTQFNDFFLREGGFNAGDLYFYRFGGNVKNNMIGGQLGFRSHVKRGHWVLSGGARVMGMHNFQSLSQRNLLEIEIGEGEGGGEGEEGGEGAGGGEGSSSEFAKNVSVVYFDLNEFVVGAEFRAEAALEITRDLSLRGGVTIVQMARGIGRGFNHMNDEGLRVMGTSFGVTYRR